MRIFTLIGNSFLILNNKPTLKSIFADALHWIIL